MPCDRRVASLCVAAAAVALVAVRCTTPPPRPAPPEVQVLLDRDLAGVELARDGAYRVVDPGGRPLAAGRRLAPGRVQPTSDGLDLNGVALAAAALRLEAADAQPFVYKGRSYAGDVRIVRDGRGRLEVHNVLDVEEYVAGVLFSEMPASFPDEALKAQGVAARSFARYRLGRGDALLRATEADQVYGGVGPHAARARALVAATRGVVLEVDGQPLCSFFMSTCGGATIDAPLVFKDAPLRGLQGVSCEFCRDSPKWRWSRSVGAGELARRLGMKSLATLDVARDSFGHSIRWIAQGAGQRKELDGDAFRRAWNAGEPDAALKLPSAWGLSLVLARGRLTIEGAGFGHGVGMCQYGAAGQAKSGRTWRDILAHYYRGATLARRW